MKNRFDSYISSVIQQLNEDGVVTNASNGPAGNNLTPNVVNSFRDVLSSMANNQQVDASKNTAINQDRLNAAVQAGVIERRDDGSHAVTDAAITHISPADTEIGGKFLPSQQSATSGKAATLKQNTSQQPQPPAQSQPNTNKAGVVGATSYGAGK